MLCRLLHPRRAALPAIVLAAALGSAGCEDSPIAPTNPNPTQTVIFSSRLQPGAFAWRSFTVAEAGSVSVQLISISPEVEAVVSLAFGTFAGSACTPTTSLDTASGTTAQITTPVSAGEYCVRVADIGNLTKDWTFSIAIVIPN
jgi:hypothetical protein